MYTKEETIIIVGIDDLKKHKEETGEEYLDYVDDNVVVARNMEKLPYSNQMIRLNLFIIVVCIEGKIQLNINGKEYRLQEGEIFVCLPTMIMSNVLLSPQHKFSLIGFSIKFLQQTVKRGKATEKAMHYLYRNPVFAKVSDGKTKDSHNFNLYYQLIMDKISNSSHLYRQEILGCLFSALFHEMLESIQKHSDDTEKASMEINRNKHIFRNFMEELTSDGGKHRSVSYYADKLCYSAKYISAAIKEVSGRTPTEWINDYAIEQIKHQLEHSDKAIKEIAEMFNFPNQSFFGRYVKTHLGMPPAHYRTYSNNKEQLDV